MNLLIKTATMFCSAVSSVLMAHNPATADEVVGVRQIVAPTEERGSDLAVTVWYPAEPGDRKSVV